MNYAAKCDNQNPFYDNIGESARNRFGRPYISGRPLLSCDRERIIQMFHHGVRKIEIARALGVTHSCVSKVIRRFEQTGVIDVGKQSRTASCACPGESSQHNPFICRHLKYKLNNSKCSKKTELFNDKKQLPKVFTIEWILSDLKVNTQKTDDTLSR
uniref:Paired domain-containing protein n=1 Tax=Panagrolaimus superbus TaxID=310955 RepID=A0A914Z6W9_9BILA